MTIGPWHVFIALLAAYCAFTSVWALDAEDSLQKGLSLLQILGCMALMYMYYQTKNSVWDMISAIKWAGYAVTVYALIFYGIDNIRDMLSSATRLENDFSNVNSIGMLSAMAIVIEVFELVQNKKLKLSVIAAIPAIIMVAATQSRKALLLVVIGVALVLLVQGLEQKLTINNVVKTLLFWSAGVLCLLALLQIPIFDGVMERMEDLAMNLFESGEGDNSSAMRLRMIALGWKTFLENPIGGIGMGCAHILAKQELAFDAYLHNNFVELLAGGGLIAFCLYYAMYVYLLVNMYEYRKYRNNEFWLCGILLVILLVMDYGAVSYISKQTYFYFMTFFLMLKSLKANSLG